jgi:hypothetical protein
MALADLYSRAISSSNLKVEARIRGDADYLIASGWAGGGSSLASLLHRARSEFDRHSGNVMTPARDALLSFTERQAALLGIELEPAALRKLSGAILDVLLRPACPSCLGRGDGIIKQTTHLSDAACPVCLGSGKRQVHVESSGESELAAEVRQRIEGKLEAHSRWRATCVSRVDRLGLRDDLVSAQPTCHQRQR